MKSSRQQILPLATGDAAFGPVRRRFPVASLALVLGFLVGVVADQVVAPSHSFFEPSKAVSHPETLMIRPDPAEWARADSSMMPDVCQGSGVSAQFVRMEQLVGGQAAFPVGMVQLTCGNGRAHLINLMPAAANRFHSDPMPECRIEDTYGNVLKEWSPRRLSGWLGLSSELSCSDAE